MYGGGAPKAWDAVTGVKIEPDVTVADLKQGHLGYTEAANGGQGNQEPIPVVPEAGGAEAKK